MKDIAMMNELSQAVLTFKGEVESLEYKLGQLAKEGVKVDAELTIEIDRNKRSSKRFWLSKDEVISILNTRLSISKQAHEDALEAYQSFLK